MVTGRSLEVIETRGWRTASDLFSSVTAFGEDRIEAGVDAPGIAFEDEIEVFLAQGLDLIDVALGIVVMMSGFRIDASHCSHHFRREPYGADSHDPGQQLYARQVIDTGVEKNVVQHMLGERRSPHVLRETAITAPVIRNRAAAMRNDEPQRRKILEQIPLNELHEGGG